MLHRILFHQNNCTNFLFVLLDKLNWEKISSDDLFINKDKKNFAEVDVEKLSIYSCEDADCTFKLK